MEKNEDKLLKKGESEKLLNGRPNFGFTTNKSSQSLGVQQPKTLRELARSDKDMMNYDQ